MMDRTLLSNPLDVAPIEEIDPNRGPPTPSPDCFYGLIGDIAFAGSANTEANPIAIALNAMVYLGCCFGRGTYMQVGDTKHHPNIFMNHVGRTALGRKGEALALCRVLHSAIVRRGSGYAPGLHSGGLSSREGLIHLIHDGYLDGKIEVPQVEDKRLYVIESEFSNVLHQTRRDGNTLSPALRDLWDGGSLKSAIKSNRIGVAEPHVAISSGITPSEYRSLISHRELLNGFSNRFIIIWAERIRVIPFPEPTALDVIELLASRIIEAIEFSGGHKRKSNLPKLMSLTPKARTLYSHLYVGELAKQKNDEILNALLQRRAPVLLRVAMILAATDLSQQIDEKHVHAAAAWTRFWADSVDYIFTASDTEDDLAKNTETTDKIIKFLSGRIDASRTEITAECFGGHVSKQLIDSALARLLSSAPPVVLMTTVQRTTGPGSPTKRYHLAAKSANSAHSDLQALTTQPLNHSVFANSAEAGSAIEQISHTSLASWQLTEGVPPAKTT